MRWYYDKHSDVYLISYPKCGRTWLRVMIAKAIAIHFQLQETNLNLLDLRRLIYYHPHIPRMQATHSGARA